VIFVLSYNVSSPFLGNVHCRETGRRDIALKNADVLAGLAVLSHLVAGLLAILKGTAEM